MNLPKLIRTYFPIFLFQTFSLLFFYTINIHADTTGVASIVNIKSFDQSNPHMAGLEDEIIITVKNAPELSDQSWKDKNIILFIEGMTLKGIHPDKNTVNKSGNGDLLFFIPHTENPVALWGHLIESKRPGELFERDVSIVVGLHNMKDDKAYAVTDEYEFRLVLVRTSWLFTCSLVIIGLLIFFIALAVKSDIIRAYGQNPTTGRKPYSLARTQMAVWFFVIIFSWLFLYVFKHTLNSISETMVILMGISSATGVGAMALDTNKNTRLPTSKGFFKDILTDSSGISFHRFQIFTWTLVLVLVFCRQVLFYFVMPDLQSSFLVLMGISSGTYLGFKATENPVNSSTTKRKPKQ